MVTNPTEPPYAIMSIKKYKPLVQYFDRPEFAETWVYRAQPANTKLETTLGLACKSSGFSSPNDAEAIEEMMISEFSRVYDGDDKQKVQDDKLYCLSLMRHYGAPCRLLDFTYSKYIAIYFALENAYAQIDPETIDHDPITCEIWCIQTDELYRRIKLTYPDFCTNELLVQRSIHESRNDISFNQLYFSNRYNFVLWENPVQIHRRLHLQQGTFLCPSDVRTPFIDNLLHPYANNKTDKIRKIIWELDLSELREGFKECRSMNITRESLFPGLDGFAHSMKYQFAFYKMLASRPKFEQGKRRI